MKYTLAKLLVVDDEKHTRRSLAMTLRNEGLNVDEAKNGEEAIKLIDNNIYDLIICDLVMAGTSGMEVLRHSKEVSPDVEIIMMTAYGSIDTAVEAMRAGAFDYLRKPYDDKELLILVEKALERNDLRIKVRNLERNLREQFGIENVIAVNPQMTKLIKSAISVANTDSNILITGDSGTGKELIARAIHNVSQYSEKPFVAVNCGALPEPLLESELFGHVKGAFTGAASNKRGLVEEANGGTLFLDEIAETTPMLQVKLLRFIQNGEVRRVGENITQHVKVRLISATNKDLQKAMEAKQFREDLYYRLSVIPLHIPPLRERTEDIPLLAQHFLKRYSKRLQKTIKNISKEAIHAMINYAWPGNVRELMNAIEHGVALCLEETLQLDDLPQSIHQGDEITPGLTQKGLGTIAEVEKNYIIKVLQEAGWSQKKASKILGLSKTTLYRRLKEYGIQPRLMSASADD